MKLKGVPLNYIYTTSEYCYPKLIVRFGIYTKEK